MSFKTSSVIFILLSFSFHISSINCFTYIPLCITNTKEIENTRFIAFSKSLKLNAKEDTTPTSITFNNPSHHRRDIFNIITSFIVSASILPTQSIAETERTKKFPDIDVNNSLAREYTAFPGLYPTIGKHQLIKSEEFFFLNSSYNK